jgi:MoaA/NifB/PqqE/SkfB family radical SAM enzyme
MFMLCVFLRTIPKKRYTPLLKLQHNEVRYELTNKCQAECVFCPRDKHDRVQGIMCLDSFKASIDEVVPLGCERVVLTGFGESFLDRGLEKKIAYAKAKGLHTYIISNAGAITRTRAIGVLEAGLDELRISFASMSAEKYEAVMVKLKFSKTLANILRFIQLRDQMGSDCKVQVSHLMLEGGEQDAKEFKEFFEPRADYIEIWKPHNWSDGRDYRELNSKKKTCGRPESGPLQIQQDGTVVPCCYDYNNQIVLGNAFKQPVMDILNGERYEALREAHRGGDWSEFPFCNGCDQLLEHSDALVYTNRHNLPPEEAVKLSNTDLHNLIDSDD